MNLNINNISYLNPLQSYLFFLDKKLTDFWQEIELKDKEIFPILEVLLKYKAYDILLPLNMIVDVYGSNETKEWWRSLIELIDCNKEVDCLTNLLYSKFRNDKRGISYLEMCDYDYFQFVNSTANIEQAVWQICNDYFDDINESKYLTCFGLYTGGLYSDFVSYKYLKYINEFSLKYLFVKAEEIVKDVFSSPYELALIKRTVYTYCSEFGVFYYNIVGNMVLPIISDDTVKLNNIPDEYLIMTLREAVNKNSRTEFYLTENFVDNLESLYRYSKRYQFDSCSCKFLGVCLPILMQCVKKYDAAVDRCFNYVNEVSFREKADERILVALYVAMFTTDDNMQVHVCNVMDGIFNSKYQLNYVGDVIRDIIIFFEKFSQELSMRFDCEKIGELKNYDPSFYGIYDICVRDFIRTEETDLSFISDAFLLSKYIFNGRVTQVMRQLADNIMDESYEYSEKLMTVTNFTNIFCSLVSHLQTEVRINVSRLCQEIDFYDGKFMSMLSDKLEIFYIYNHEQIKELMTLEKRFREACDKIPQYGAVLNYEGKLSYYFRRKILEQKKNKIGSRLGNIFVVKN